MKEDGRMRLFPVWTRGMIENGDIEDATQDRSKDGDSSDDRWVLSRKCVQPTVSCDNERPK